MPPRWKKPPPNSTARYAVADVTDHAALRDAIASLGPCDILVNNAGAAISKPFDRHTLADFQTMLAVNLLSAVTACQAVLPDMRAKNFGRIVNIASTAGLKGYAYITAYVAAKHALVGFTRALALETVQRRHHRECGLPRLHRHRHGDACRRHHRSRRRNVRHRKHARNWQQAIPPAGWCGRRKWRKRSPSCAGPMPAP